MIRRAVLQDIPALMDIYNEAILHTTATFDTEVKDMEDRRAFICMRRMDLSIAVRLKMQGQSLEENSV